MNDIFPDENADFVPHDIPEEFRPPHENYRSGMVAVVGCANAGKSSLINTLLGEKVSIVSPVAQTTRNLIRGILSEDEGQVVFLDTPGLHKPHGELGKRMNKTARSSANDVDVVLLVLDRCKEPQEEDRIWMRQLSKQQSPLIFALNKSDIPKNHGDVYRGIWKECTEGMENPPQPVWMEMSAKTGADTDALKAHLFAMLPRGPMLFPEDVISDFPRKIMISDIIREQLFQVLYGDMPHEIAIRIDMIEEKDALTKIDAKVLVHHPAQKGIVIGAKGRQLKKVTRIAEENLEEALGKKVKLSILVKVEKDWQKNFWILKQLGYDGTV